MDGPGRSASSVERQQGAALFVTLVLVALIGVTAVIAFAQRSSPEEERERRTTEALAAAKAALIGFAAGVTLTPTGEARPGDLPCPDLDDDGSAELSCSNETARLGRLPWKTLGLGDLRDGDGERLWYAVANGFKNNPRTTCGNHADPGCLNSETRGTISVRNASGTLVHDATNPDPVTASGAVAVIVAPGAALTRDGSGSPQDRSAAGINNPLNYLDVQSGGEDNANFSDATTNGLIAGPVVGANRKILINDRLLVIGRQDLMPVLERRVALEVARCLNNYAAAASNAQKYPWAADMLESGLNNNYSDSMARRYGRIPEPPFTQTQADDPAGTMSTAWIGVCSLPTVAIPLGQSWWWNNWKSQVIYALAQAYQPSASSPVGCGASCLVVNRPTGGPAIGVRMVVMVAGRVLGGQNRSAPLGTVNTNPANYVEFENATNPVTPDPTFQAGLISATFNDRIAYFPP